MLRRNNLVYRVHVCPGGRDDDIRARTAPDKGAFIGRLNLD
jgi:hypothetical protein